MRYNGVLLDLDNTLYDYETAHAAALGAAAEFLARDLKMPADDFFHRYAQARKSVHAVLKGTAAAHNRLLYFQKLLETAGTNPFRAAWELYRIYWEVFMENVRLFDGVDRFFEVCRGKKICLVTDLTADVQYQKIKSLRLEEKIQFIVTSEEVGKEKPAPDIFRAALTKMGCGPGNVCMVGDDYERDVCGARGVGIIPFWLNRSRAPGDITGVKEFFSFAELVEGLAHDLG